MSFQNYVGWKNHFRCPRKCIKLKIFYRLSVQRNDLRFVTFLCFYSPFLCSYSLIQDGVCEGGMQNLTLRNLNQATPQISVFAISGQILTEMLELPNYDHRIFESRDKTLSVTSWREIVTS